MKLQLFVCLIAAAIIAPNPAHAQTLKDILGGGKKKIDDQMTKSVGEAIGVGEPLLLDQHDAFSEYSQPVLNFSPKPLNIFSEDDLDKPLAPGDYSVQVMFYCSLWSIHCPGRGIPYKLGRIKGRLAPAIGALLVRGTMQRMDPASLNAVAWRLEDGMSWNQLSPQDQKTIDSLIPDYEPDLQGDYLQKVHDSYDKFKLVPGAPTFDQMLTKLGPVGQSFQELERARQTLANTTVSDERLPDMLYEPSGDGLPRVLPDAKSRTDSPWAEICPGVLARFTVEGGYCRPNLFELRVLPSTYSTLESYHIQSWDSPIQSAGGVTLSNAMGLTDMRAPGSGGGDPTLPLDAYPISAGAQIPTIAPILGCPPAAIGNLPTLKNAADRAKAQQLAYQLMGALSELGAYRGKYLKDGDFIDLFPTMYYDTTLADMSRIADNAYQYPIEHMQQMLDFFDAYKYNRTSWDTNHTAEPWWATHFQEAETDQAKSYRTPIQLYEVLSTAIDAHVNHDLGRALRDSYDNRYDTSATPDELHPDFLVTDNTFGEDAAQKYNDLYAAAENSNDWEQYLHYFQWEDSFGDFMTNSTAGVIRDRHTAWDEAMSKVTLPSGSNQQPRTDHQKLYAEGMSRCQ